MIVPGKDEIAEGGVPRRIDASTLPHFRGSLGRFATGVAIVAFGGQSKRHGITVNSFTSVSMDPPLLLVAIARATKAHDGGDHTLCLREVQDCNYRRGDALAFANSAFTTIPERHLGVEELL
jgi:hypothetical protein